MNLKEYEMQLALGTVDFRLAANETQSSIVLQDIIGRTDDIAVLYAVATNPETNIYTLTLLATFPDAEEGVIISCAYHPNITLNILERWMKYPTIKCVGAVQRRVRALQLASGVSEKDALFVSELPPLSDILKRNKISDNTGWYGTKQADYAVWTTAGNNKSIEMDDSRFKFASDPGDATVYYSYNNYVCSCEAGE
jgi:hypothetical protein